MLETSHEWQPDPDGPTWLVTLRWALLGGRVEPISLDVRREHLLGVDTGEHVVTATLLRMLPVGRIVAEGRRHLEDDQLAAVAQDDLRAVIDAPTWSAEAAERARDALRALRDDKRGGRPPTYDAEHWAEVARVYGEAWATTDAPTKAVAEHFTVAKSTAAKWVARSRKLGLLPETTRGRANARRDER